MGLIMIISTFIIPFIQSTANVICRDAYLELKLFLTVMFYNGVFSIIKIVFI
jgi:hypothetical protein